MPTLPKTKPATPAEFAARLHEFITRVLPSLDRREREWPPILPDTPLFTAGLLDSLSILHLIALLEELTGEPVPDALVVMKNFQSIEAITAAFWRPPQNTAAAL